MEITRLKTVKDKLAPLLRQLHFLTGIKFPRNLDEVKIEAPAPLRLFVGLSAYSVDDDGLGSIWL